MARTPDLVKRRELLDEIVDYLAENGLGQATLRPMASSLGVSLNRLVHHFGSKEDLLAAALQRGTERQIDVQERWLRRTPDMTIIELYRRWWVWMNSRPSHLALVRLSYEAAALNTMVSGLAGPVRAEQIGVWRIDVERRLIREGLAPERAAVQASVMKATFSGFIIDLIATGERKRLTIAVEEAFRQFEQILANSRV